MKKKGLSVRILELLDDRLAMRNMAIAEELGEPPSHVSSVTNRLFKQGKLFRFPDQINGAHHYCLPQNKHTARLAQAVSLMRGSDY